MVVCGLNVTVLGGRGGLALGASSGVVSTVSAIAFERLKSLYGKRGKDG